MQRSKVKLWYCGNCDRRHWGYWETYRYFEGTESEFVWTTPQGVLKKRPAPCLYF